MIINWLLCSLLVGGILAIAGVAFEYGARALRLPTRWVWIGIMAMSTMFSALTLVKGLVASAQRRTIDYATPAIGSPIDSDSVPVRVWNARESARGRPWNRQKQSILQPAFERVLNSTGGLPAAIGVSERSYQSFDTPLFIICCTLVLLGLIMLAVTFARLSGVAYALDDAVVEGVPVLLSRNIGPALLGVVRFRVVLPRWVTEMPSADVRTILAHEHEHALARDPILTLVALVMAALQPWSPALWFALSRLRLATEADCDARVLGPDGDVRQYGHLLVNVYQRAQSGLSPLTSFVTRTSQLESRIRRMVDAAPKSFAPKTVAAFAIALMLCTLAYSLEVTAQRSSNAAPAPAVDSTVAAPSATMQSRAKVPARAPRDSVRSGHVTDSIRRLRQVVTERALIKASLALLVNDAARRQAQVDSVRNIASAQVASDLLRKYLEARSAFNDSLRYDIREPSVHAFRSSNLATDRAARALIAMDSTNAPRNRNDGTTSVARKPGKSDSTRVYNVDVILQRNATDTVRGATKPDSTRRAANPHSMP